MAVTTKKTPNKTHNWKIYYSDVSGYFEVYFDLQQISSQKTKETLSSFVQAKSWEKLTLEYIMRTNFALNL